MAAKGSIHDLRYLDTDPGSEEIDPNNANGNEPLGGLHRILPYADTPPESDTEDDDISSVSNDSVSPEIPESKAETSVVFVEFTIEEVDPLDDSWDALEVIHPYDIEYPRSRTNSFHKDSDKALVAELQGLDCSDSEADLDGEEDAFLRIQRLYRRSRRISMQSSFGKRAYSEIDNWDDDYELSDGDENRGNDKTRKRVHTSTLLFNDPPVPIIEPDELDSDVEDGEAEDQILQELPFFNLEIMSVDSDFSTTSSDRHKHSESDPIRREGENEQVSEIRSNEEAGADSNEARPTRTDETRDNSRAMASVEFHNNQSRSSTKSDETPMCGSNSIDNTDLESLFSSFSASSMESLTTLDHRQRSGVALLTELLFNHRELSPLYKLAISRVEIGKLRTHLYGFFRIYGKELHREASDEKERLAAQFIRRCARLLANAICQSLQSESGEEDWSSLLSIERVSMEQNVNEWINASLTNVESLIPQVIEGDEKIVDSSRAETASSESSNEDYEVVYEEPEDYLLLSEVEHFILSADAFSNLKLALRAWLNLDDGNSEGETPLETDPSAASSKHTSHKLLALLSMIRRAGMAVFHNVQNVLILTGFREPELVDGYQRVRWKNKKNKGKTLFEDYLENEPGALRTLEAYLNTCAYQKNNTGSTSASSSSEQRTHNTNSSASGSIGSSSLQTNVSCHSGQGIGPNETTRAFETDIELTASPSESLHLFTCIERGFHKLDFSQKVITNIPNDQTLFESLREEHYCGYQGRWRRIISLRAIQSVHFMKVADKEPSLDVISEVNDSNNFSSSFYMAAPATLIHDATKKFAKRAGPVTVSHRPGSSARLGQNTNAAPSLRDCPPLWGHDL
ncbi:unnamed protein product [Clonostachys solani]|uniref:Uncharacterized protein n=1 Tax=Clonostachys solani TaxID=160281 RepID=A0A9N9YXW9_9HYPO|nr:unnamed protein product [Clonostachys solani]